MSPQREAGSEKVTREREAVISALIAVLLWSTVASGFKLGLRHLDVLQLLFLGSLVSWLLFALAKVVNRPPPIIPSERGTVVWLGLINPFLYYIILFEAYDRLPAQVAQPLNYTWAIVLAVLAVPLLKQKLTARAAAGMVTSYAGVVVLVWRNPVDAAMPLDALGLGFALASTVLWAGYWLINTRCRSDPLAMMFSSFSVALPVIAAACWWGPGWPVFTTTNVFYGAWIGLLEMGATFLLWQRALRLTDSAARISQLIFIAPFLSFALIAVVLDEPIGWTSIAGFTVIVTGLVITGMPDIGKGRKGVEND